MGVTENSFLFLIHLNVYPCLADVYDICVKDGEKTLAVKWLDQIGEIGLAWWFCDDG
ncbi:MAG: hypothetical protein IPK63_19000 [Candidatus Competibacteraceae bacterium]|nr:hypothetical protein [Candidatus Competibacteraceae bacterium]